MAMEQRALKKCKDSFEYQHLLLDTSNLYLNVVHFFHTSIN